MMGIAVSLLPKILQPMDGEAEEDWQRVEITWSEYRTVINLDRSVTFIPVGVRKEFVYFPKNVIITQS